MNDYTAPLEDIRFNIHHIAAVEGLIGMPDAGADSETLDDVLVESARFVEKAVAPLNQPSDTCPAALVGNDVRTPPGFKEAFHHYRDAGWQGLEHPVSFGGQALPKAVVTACSEMLNAACMGFALCPVLTNGAIEALLVAGSEDLKSTYLSNLVSGRWSGTMNLTEPHAGSDLSGITTRAESQANGSYLLFGTKMFITYGEHDLTENIIHLVLARTAGAPSGVKGLSLFVVPKFIVEAGGALGRRNDVRCGSLEHKLGIRGSPTALMHFGDQGGAVGHLVGREHKGLEYMFVMMNATRFTAGVQGVAIAERACQAASAHARARRQGRRVGHADATHVPIVEHPDVRRNLMMMRTLTQGCRALVYATAGHMDAASVHPDAEVRRLHQTVCDFLVPVLKGFCTEAAQKVASLCLQVHGGMGFVEETGVSQYLRDARILTIYEGTTGIQAADLVMRKTVRDNGQAAKTVATMVEETEFRLADSGSVAARAVLARLRVSRACFLQAASYMVDVGSDAPDHALAGSVPYLMLAGKTVVGWQLARALLAAERNLLAGVGSASFLESKIAIAVFCAEHILIDAQSIRDRVVNGGASVMALPAHKL